MGARCSTSPGSTIKARLVKNCKGARRERGGGAWTPENERGGGVRKRISQTFVSESQGCDTGIATRFAMAHPGKRTLDPTNCGMSQTHRAQPDK